MTTYGLTNSNIVDRLNKLPSNYWFANQKGDYTDWALKCQAGSEGFNVIQYGLRAGAIFFFFAYGFYLWTRFPNPQLEDSRLRRFSLCSSLNAYIMLFTGLINIIQLSQADDFFLDNCFRVDIAKYFQWAVTCPLMTLQVAILANAAPQRMIETHLSTLFMLLLGIGASMAPEFTIRLAMFFAAGWFFFLLWYTYNNIVMEGTKRKETLFRGSSFMRKTALFVLVSWTLFPIIWILGPEGADVINGAVMMGGITVIDFLSKALFSLFIFWVRAKWGGQMLAGELEEWERADEATRLAMLMQHIGKTDSTFLSRIGPDGVQKAIRSPSETEKLLKDVEKNAKKGEQGHEAQEELRKKGRLASGQLMQLYMSRAGVGGFPSAAVPPQQQQQQPARFQQQMPTMAAAQTPQQGYDGTSGQTARAHFADTTAHQMTPMSMGSMQTPYSSAPMNSPFGQTMPMQQMPQQQQPAPFTQPQQQFGGGMMQMQQTMPMQFQQQGMQQPQGMQFPQGPGMYSQQPAGVLPSTPSFPSASATPPGPARTEGGATEVEDQVDGLLSGVNFSRVGTQHFSY